MYPQILWELVTEHTLGTTALLCWTSVIHLQLIVNCILPSIKCTKVLFMQLHICLLHVEYKNFPDLQNWVCLCHKNLNMVICRKWNNNWNVLQLGADMWVLVLSLIFTLGYVVYLAADIISGIPSILCVEISYTVLQKQVLAPSWGLLLPKHQLLLYDYLRCNSTQINVKWVPRIF